MRVRNREPLKPIDYAVMFGGPVLFLLFAAALVFWVLGPAPPDNPVRKIREGAVVVGMTTREVERAVGPPWQIVAREDGGATYLYRFSGFDVQTTQPLEEDASVEFDGAGRVRSVTTDRQVPPTPSAP